MLVINMDIKLLLLPPKKLEDFIGEMIGEVRWEVIYANYPAEKILKPCL